MHSHTGLYIKYNNAFSHTDHKNIYTLTHNIQKYMHAHTQHIYKIHALSRKNIYKIYVLSHTGLYIKCMHSHTHKFIGICSSVHTGIETNIIKISVIGKTKYYSAISTIRFP